VGKGAGITCIDSCDSIIGFLGGKSISIIADVVVLNQPVSCTKRITLALPRPKWRHCVRKIITEQTNDPRINKTQPET
jgi:hypothetical protein